MRFEHGEHNESLCDHLLAIKAYNDWIVTTAFYACIHFVEHKLFPLKNYKGRDFNNFNEYCDFEHNENNSKLSKHSLKVHLVKVFIPGIKTQYRTLKDACMNSRYTDYKVSDHKANSCSATMKVIKRNCVKSTPL